MLQARLLGQFEICLDGQPVIISSRPSQSLFAYFLLHPQKSHRREKLAGQFWPEANETNARSNLRHALWRIRKAFGPPINERLLSDDLGVTYHPQPGDQVDVDSLEAGLKNENCIDEHILAISAYDGDLLPGFYEEWVILERERLHAVLERRLSRLMDLLLAEKRWDDVLEWGERWIAMGDIPEPAYRAIMLAYAGSGNFAAAATQYQRCKEILANELGVEPSEMTRHVLEQIRDGSVEQILRQIPQPALSIPHLPAFLEEPEKPLPVFVGRKAELATLKRYLEKALQGKMQVVFVKGEAGSGKTALLQAFLHRSLVSYPDLIAGWGICSAFFGQGDPYLPFRDVLDVLTGGIETTYTNGAISRNQAVNLLTSFPLILHALLEQGPDLINSFLSGSTLESRVETMLPGEQGLKKEIEKLILREPVYEGEHEKTRLLEQYTLVLRTIAGQRPVIIMLDDLQWMDLGSGRLLFHLVRRLQNTRIIIVGAYRAEEIALGWHGERHPLEPLLNEFQTSFGEILIDLDQGRETSGRDFIDAFLDTEPNQLDENFRQELFRRTQGHPLFTIQLLRNLQERGEILSNSQKLWTASKDLKWDCLPKRIEGVIGERIGRMESKPQHLLLVASVEGEQFTLQVLERILGKEKRVVLLRLCRELEKRHRLIQELGEIRVGDQRLMRFKFMHTLIQQYMYHQLGQAERAELHLEVAEILESLYKEDNALVAVPLAHHYREAGIKEKAVEYMLQAGDQSRNLYAQPEAIEYYKQALAILEEMRSTEQIARTLMKLYLVYHSSFDFQHAQEVLEECNAHWQKLAERDSKQGIPTTQNPYRLAILKFPTFDPAMCDTLFDIEWINELFCGLVEWSEDRNVIPMAAKNWDILEGGRRYLFHLREDIQWSDGEPVTAQDFEFAWKRVLNPATHSLSANMLYDIRGAKDFHLGLVENSEQVGVSALDQYTLAIELEEPCSYFLFLLGDPISFAVPRHVIEINGNAWTKPDRIVSNGAFQLDTCDQTNGKTIHFTRNPRYFGRYKGNIERVSLVFQRNELEMYNSFVAGKLDTVRFLIPPIQQDVLKHYREVSQFHISNVPFVDAVYFIVNRPPFDNHDLRRAFVLATDREKLAREIENQHPATGGYIPPGLAGHSPSIGLPYDPQEARRILAAAGYPEGKGFPSVSLMLNIVGLEKGDNLVFDFLQEMWEDNLGITVQKCINESSYLDFEAANVFQLFFVGWLADYPDPAAFLQTNFLIEQSRWRDPIYEQLIEQGRRTLDQNQRLEFYRRADRVLIEAAVVLPLFYGHINELRQPWVKKPSGTSIYSPQWKDITLMPH